MLNKWTMSTYITYINHYLCWHISSIIYADIHHPWVQLECFIQVCWLASPKWNLDLIKYADLHHPCIFYISWSMLTYITHGYIWIAWFKYVNTYQSLSLLTYIKHNLCWHTSPMGTIRMIYSSMLTCINHIYSLSLVCWLSSPMYILDFKKYADLHHPWICLNCLN